jgi:hypothetical protein
MSEPDWNPDTAGRSLAEILREAGIEAPRSGRRRRWDDEDDTGIRQRGSGTPPHGEDSRPGYGRRRSDLQFSEPPPARESRRPVPEPSTAAIPGLRPDRTPAVPGGDEHPATGPVGRRRAADRGVPAGTDRSPRRAPRADVLRDDVLRDDDGHPSTGPIPVIRDEDLDDDLAASPRESALAWLRFAGELVIALAAGIGVYFAATILWENIPFLAVLLAPLAVAALVAGVGFWRHRHGRDPVDHKLLAVLVFAGTLLTIAPAANLLAAS